MINKHIQRLRTAEDGFDLVQALVVVVILGALATIAVLSLLNQAGKGDAANVRTNTQQAITTAKRIQAESGSTGAWAANIAADVQTETNNRVDAQVTGTNLIMTTVRGSNGCRATMARATGVVSFSTPPSTWTDSGGNSQTFSGTQTCPNN